MTVEELIEKLKNMNPDLKVLVADINDPLPNYYEIQAIALMVYVKNEELNACYIQYG